MQKSHISYISRKLKSSIMVLSTFTSSTTTKTTPLILLLLILFRGSSAAASEENDYGDIPKTDAALLRVALNLEYLEAEFFSWGALGAGLDVFAPELTKGGPPPLGPRKADLSPLLRSIIEQFAFQEYGHLRAIQSAVEAFPRPLMNLSRELFADVISDAFGEPLVPPFDPYANDINYLIASYVIPYVGLTGYVGANPKLQDPRSKMLVAGLLGVEAGQDAVIRTLLYENAFTEVKPYGITVADFTKAISGLRNALGMKGVKDEGLIVKRELGAEGRVSGNILAGDEYSLSYARTPEEVLKIVYTTGNVSMPGGFYPKGANGEIAKSYLGYQVG